MDRRDFVKRAMGSTGLALAWRLGGSVVMLTPQQAHARQVSLQQLSVDEASVLQGLADIIVPGAVDAGVVHFIDHQLGVSPDDSLLILKFFEIPPPHIDFYRGGINAVQAIARQRFGRGFDRLDHGQREELVRHMATPGIATADGYPLFLFYMCLRSDAVDLVYGTAAGFKRLNVPYMAHIMPPQGWTDSDG